MSLLSRDVQVDKNDIGYFDHYFRNMPDEMKAKEQEMATMINQMRQQMFQVGPTSPQIWHKNTKPLALPWYVHV